MLFPFVPAENYGHMAPFEQHEHERCSRTWLVRGLGVALRGLSFAHAFQGTVSLFGSDIPNRNPRITSIFDQEGGLRCTRGGVVSLSRGVTLDRSHASFLLVRPRRL